MSKVYADIKTEIGSKIQKSDPTYKTNVIADIVNRNYELLWNNFIWPEICVVDEEVTVTSGSPYVYLPKRCGEILVITQRESNIVLSPQTYQTFQQRYLGSITSSGYSVTYHPAGEFGVKSQPSAASQLVFVSSSASDTSQYIRIWGIVGNEELSEKVLLSGTGTSTSVNSYTEVNRLSKDSTTAGTITVTDGTNTIATISPTETESRYKRIRLYAVPSSAFTVYLTYKRRFKKLVNNEDTLEIPIEPVLIKLCYSDCLNDRKKFSEARMIKQEATGDLNATMNAHAILPDGVTQTFPQVEKLPDDMVI